MSRIKDGLRPYVWILRRLRRGELPVADLAWGQVVSFSQFGEDLALDRLFRGETEGFYVDVGAFHPFKASNTVRLHRRGWRGINIEPDPDGAAQLRRHRPDDTTVQVAVGASAGQAKFVRAGLTAGIDDAGRLWQATHTAPRITVDVMPLAAVLDEHLPGGQRIDLLDVDCEGHDLDVLMSNDWTKYRPRVVLAECHDERADAINSYLVGLGYRLLQERLYPTALYVDASSDLVR